jgi:hypothetical protein
MAQEKADQTVEGGRYIIGGRTVNANGQPLDADGGVTVEDGLERLQRLFATDEERIAVAQALLAQAGIASQPAAAAEPEPPAPAAKPQTAAERKAAEKAAKEQQAAEANGGGDEQAGDATGPVE